MLLTTTARIVELNPEELKVVSGGANKKQIAWRIFQVVFVSSYIGYKIYLAVLKIKEVPGSEGR